MAHLKRPENRPNHAVRDKRAVAARWLLRYLEEHSETTIDEAALAASCLAALRGYGHAEATQALHDTGSRRRMRTRVRRSTCGSARYAGSNNPDEMRVLGHAARFGQRRTGSVRPTSRKPVTGLGPADPVPDGYPFALKDQELEAVLRDMLTAIPGFDKYSALLPELKLTLIFIGAQERARREADRVGRRLFWITAGALAVAVVSLNQ